MRIADADGKPLTKVYIALTDPEAKELRDALEDLETRPKRAGTPTSMTSNTSVK